MKFIVAVDEKWGIGKNGDLLLSIPEDMLYYRSTTRGKVVVMGYATLLSLPNSKPAPGRLNLVLADIEGLRIPGAVVCGSMEQLHKLIGCFEPDDVFDVGGGSMYRHLNLIVNAISIPLYIVCSRFTGLFKRLTFDSDIQQFLLLTSQSQGAVSPTEQKEDCYNGCCSFVACCCRSGVCSVEDGRVLSY